MECGPSRLMAGILSSPGYDCFEALPCLEKRFGSVYALTESQNFLYTDYYTPEMGAPLTRRFILFEQPADPLALAEAKKFSISLETALAQSDGRRKINIDPGIFCAGSLVLATTKYRPHRLALAPEIWGELTLIFERGEYRALPWTYPDYAEESNRNLFGLWRKHMLEQERQTASKGESAC